MCAVGVVNDDDAAVAALPTGKAHHAVAGGAYRRAVGGFEVGAFVRADDAGDGVQAAPGQRGELMWS